MDWRIAAAVLVAALTVLGSGTVALVGDVAGTAPCTDCNIVLVSIEPLRADHVGAYGYRYNTTPVIDRIAAEGAVFQQAYTTSSNTLPATMSTFTGLYPSQHGVNPDTGTAAGNADRFTMLAEVLDRHGFYTVGLHGGANVRGELGFDRGFDRYIPRFGINNFSRAVSDQLSDREGNRTFLYVQTFGPHDPYFAPDRYYGEFGDVSDAFRNESRDRWTEINDRFSSWDNLTETQTMERIWKTWRDGYYWPRLARNETLREHAISGYDSRVRVADDYTGDVVDALKREGMWDDTIVIVTAQHGEEFGEHGDWEHTQLYNEVMRIPLIIHLPGMTDRTDIGRLVQTLDITPTVLDLAGIRPDTAQEMAGRSMLPALWGEQVRRYALAEREFGTAAFIDARTGLKYIRTRSGPELYNISADPAEQHALRDTDLREMMEQRLRDFYADLGTGGTDGPWPYFG